MVAILLFVVPLMPANLVIVLETTKRTIYFENLKPENVLALFYSEYDLRSMKNQFGP
jgi:hypothetical protein